MGLFKVNFKNNCAISGRKIPGSMPKSVKRFVTKGTKQFIQWYVVDAEDETQAVDMANKLAKKIWGEILGMK
jgi:hypothetical protein